MSDKVMYDGRTQETVDQQLTPPTSHHRPVNFNQTHCQSVSFRFVQSRKVIRQPSLSGHAQGEL